MSSSTWPIHVDPSHLYFVTTGTQRKATIFRRECIKRILVDSLNIGRILKQYDLFAFVIMPNHIHFIMRCLGDFTPSDAVREFKKSTANLIIRQLSAEQNEDALNFLTEHAPSGQECAIWMSEFQAKNVYSAKFLRQKLTYIHNNPCQPHWQLAEKPEAYIWSSAGFYLKGQKALIPLSDARELL